MRARVFCYLCVFAILFSFMSLSPVRANPDVTAFVDGGSVAIGTGETTIATLSTSFVAGNNFVIAIVEFQSTATLDPAIAAGNLKLTRSGTTLRSNQYAIAISSSDPQNQKWFALMAFDSGAGASPSYDVRATAQGTGISGEAKILAISGLTGSSVQGSSITIDEVETTLATLPTSLPAGDNVVIAILESSNTAQGARNLGNPSFRISRSSALADGQYWTFHLGKATVPRWHVHLIPYLDINAPANPTYVASSKASWPKNIDGRATIVAFSVTSTSGLSAAYSDGDDMVLGTSETAMNTLSTSFQSGSEVAVIASEQFYWGASSGTDYINAGNNKLQQNDQPTGQATNQYTLTHGDFIDDDTGRGFGLLNRFTSTPPNPQYKVKATMVNANSVKGEAKILAICASPPPTNFEFVDGGSVAIGTSETTLATLSTSSFGAGNNLVMAIVQFSISSGSTYIQQNDLRLTRGGTTIRSNAYFIYIESTPPNNQKWFALMALDSGAPANPTYDVRATGYQTGISGEAKILAISGLTGASTLGSSTVIGTSETTLATLSTSLPAGDNVVIAILESRSTDANTRYVSALNLKRTTPAATLASAQYPMIYGPTVYGAWHVQLIPYFDSGAPASAEYSITAIASAAFISGRATIVAFSRGSLSAAYSDGDSTAIGTSPTTINALATSFTSGNEVAVIASQQLNNTNTGSTRTIASGSDLLEQNLQTSGATSNEYTIQMPIKGQNDNGKGFGLLNKYTSIPSSPEYEVVATASATDVNGEAKILALCKPPIVPEFPLGPMLVLVICFPILFVVRGRKKDGIMVLLVR